ncbi:DUF4181 domain-containing protein [Alteribacter lacisalsi]|uniref:DUF4181 domain-containing protein n=1 Tax=Alteribacter lacisalsi TaxID=2045244 RepID=UPI001374DD70|nr:DUF4181 domain-containing protein [Alteribacter lacisalsi]
MNVEFIIFMVGFIAVMFIVDFILKRSLGIKQQNFFYRWKSRSEKITMAIVLGLYFIFAGIIVFTTEVSSSVFLLIFGSFVLVFLVRGVFELRHEKEKKEYVLSFTGSAIIFLFLVLGVMLFPGETLS